MHRLLPEWARALLCCPACRADLSPETWHQAGTTCSTCGRSVEIVDGVVEALADAHPAVESERRAVAALDAGEASLSEPVGSEAARLAFEAHVETSRRQLREVLEARPLPPGATVVELGADACWASELFLDSGARVIAVDISDHLHLARRADDENLVRLRADMNDLPLRDATVDVVWASAAAHHSWDLQRTFDEAARVLRRDGEGRLHFCCEPMPSWLRWPFGLTVGDEERELGINETWVARRGWLQRARRAGFEAELEFPRLDADLFAHRLARRGVPPALGRRLLPLVRPVLPLLQVSIHLHARLPG